MYKQFSRDDWLQILKLPEDYKVDAVVITGTPSKVYHLALVEEVLQNLKDGSNIQSKDFSNVDFVRSTEIAIDGKVIWFDTSYGSAYLSEIVHIGSMLGSKKNILLGSCGGLDKNANALDLIIPTFSYGDESTTRMYARYVSDNKHYADSKLSSELANIFSDNHKVHIKPLITCQAHLGETLEDIKEWSASGYAGVEMESASMFAVSNHFRIPSAAVLHINDNLVENEYVGSTENTKKKILKKELIKDKYFRLFKYLQASLQ